MARLDALQFREVVHRNQAGVLPGLWHDEEPLFRACHPQDHILRGDEQGERIGWEKASRSWTALQGILQKKIKLPPLEMITADELETKQKEKPEMPIAVMVSAKWCEPCEEIEPDIQRLAQEFAGRVELYKMDLENPKNTAFINQYVMVNNVTKLPTILSIKAGNYEIIGTTDVNDIRRKLLGVLMGATRNR